MSETRNDQLALKALQNIAHQLSRLADAQEVKNAIDEERWEPTNYRADVQYIQPSEENDDN